MIESRDISLCSFDINGTTDKDHIVNIRRRKTELVLPKGQFATYETNIPPKHIILKSECDRSIYVSVFQALNPSNLKESKYVSCESNSWLFNTTDEELKIIKIENRNSVVLTVKRLAAGSSTVEKTIAILHPDGKKRLRQRTVSGIPIGPDSIEELIKKVIDISNSGSEFTRNDFKSALLIAELKQSLYQFEVNVTNKLSVIERKRDIEDHLAGTTVLFKEIELMRKHIFTSSYASEDLEVEWKAFNQRLLESIRTSLFSTLSRALESIFDDSKKFTYFCANIPSGTHRCIKDNVNSFENTIKLKLKSLPADLASDANIYIDAALKRINNNLNYCRDARSSYSYTTMGKRDKLISIAADIETELREDAQKQNPEELINLVKDYLFLPFVPSVNRIINCKVDRDLAYDQLLLAAVSSAKRFLQISLKRNKFEKDSGKLYAKFDFMNIVSKVELFNRQMRVVDEDCDLPSILSKVPENVEELNILCMNTLVYGHSSTNLRRLRVDTVNLEVNSKGASLKLVEPSAPVKATSQVVGSKGIDAGFVEIRIHSFVTGGVLEVVANGGPGGAGGDGVLGGKGSNGVHGNIQSHFYNKAHYDSIPNSGLIQKNVVEHHCRKRKKWYRRKKSYVCGRTVNYVQRYNHVSVGMTSGGKGASGTSGAPGGAGGKAGSLTVELNGLNRNHFKLSGKGGAGGAGGLGGGGGEGGIGGNRKSLAVTYTRIWDWHENSGERMTSSGVSTSERISGKENDGPKGENGPNGSQGPLGDLANPIEFRNISEERTLFVMLSKLKTEIEPTYMSNGNGLKSVRFVQDLLGLFQNQKEVVSNVSLLYKQQNHSSIVMNLIREESKLLTKIITFFETEQKNLQILENNFKELSANQQNDLVLTSKDVEMARVAIEETSNNFYVRERDIATNPKTVTENLDKAISTIISIVTVAEAFNERNVDLGEIYHAAKKFTERTGHNSGIFTLASNIRIEYPELKNCSSLFYNISVLNMFFKNKVKDDKKIENISGNVPKCTLKNFFSDGYRLRNYIHYFKITDLNRRPRSSVQNMKTYSEYYQLRSFLHTTLGTIMANRSSHILHSMSSHVQVRNKVELVIRDSNYIEELVKSLREKVQVFKSIKQHPAMNQSDVVEFLDNIVEKCIFALTDIGKELRRKIQSIRLQLIPYFPDSRALEKLADLSPWSSTSNFSSSLLTLQELINKKLTETQKLSIYLDSFDFPVEFSFLRSGNNATFPILGSTINQLFVSTVEAKALNKDLTPIPSISVSAYREEGDYLNLGSFSSNSHTSNDFRKLTSAKMLSSSETLSSVYILDSYYTIVISNDSHRIAEGLTSHHMPMYPSSMMSGQFLPYGGYRADLGVLAAAAVVREQQIFMGQNGPPRSQEDIIKERMNSVNNVPVTLALWIPFYILDEKII
ncbi:hypothetical protein QYM36_011081, partial [Artemia franciscana]